MKEALEAAGVEPVVAEITMKALNETEVEGDVAVKFQKMLDMLDDLDDGVGQLLAAIDKLGIGENTYVFFSSDNGGSPDPMPAERRSQPARNHPFRMTKQYLYEGGIRVPFIVRGPGVKAGAVRREPVAQYDLAHFLRPGRRTRAAAGGD